MTADMPRRAVETLGPQFESLIRLAEAIRRHPDQKDLFQMLADELRQVVPFDAICQVTPARRLTGISPRFAIRRSVGCQTHPKETVGWWVDQTQQSVVLRVDDQETRFPTTIQALQRLGLRSLCAVPLSTAHSQLGSLLFASQFLDAYSPEEVRFLSLVAAQIALAMDDALAQQRLKLLLDLTNGVVSKLDLRELLREVSASIRRMMQCSSVGRYAFRSG